MEPMQWVQVGTIVVSFLVFLIPIRLRKTIIEKEVTLRLWPWIITTLPRYTYIEVRSLKKFFLRNRGFELEPKETEDGFVISGNFIGDIRISESRSVKLTVRGRERPVLVTMRLDPPIELICYASSLALFLHGVIRLFA